MTSRHPPSFSGALAQHLRDQGRSQIWLAEDVSKRTGRKRLFDQSTVTRWVSGKTTPDAPTVFAIEEALGLPPGSLSRLLGYLPIHAAEALTVPAAVDADPQLTVMGRRVMLKVYEELVADGPDGSDA